MASLRPGTIGTAQSICYNTAPAALTQLTAPTGGTGGSIPTSGRIHPIIQRLQISEVQQASATLRPFLLPQGTTGATLPAEHAEQSAVLQSQ